MKIILKDGKKRVVTFSYDDEPVFDRRLIEIFDKNGLKGTFNINTGIYDKWGERHLSREEAIELYKNSGHEVAVHSYSHPFLDQLSSTELINEVIEDRKNIERDYGVITRGLAYPMGTFNNEVADVLAKCGIVYGRTTKDTRWFDFPENWLMWHPTAHHNTPNLMELAKNFIENDRNANWRARLFYVWGHSYEFDEKNNWEVIEELAEYIGGRDNVWYATNIEIYDYVTAYKRLETSFDNSIIYNPSAITVWFEKNEKIYSIGPGETLIIK